MQRKSTKLNFAGQDIYVGLDTGKRSWKVSILTKESEGCVNSFVYGVSRPKSGIIDTPPLSPENE